MGGLALVAIVAVAVAALLLLRGTPAAVPMDDGVVAEGPVVLATVPAVATSPSPRPSASPVVVDVAGAVRKPGVHRLPAGSRVVDALRAAGGAVPGTDLSDIPQARLLVDGEQVRVGLGPAPASAAGLAATGAGGRVGLAGAATEQSPLDLNAATADQLDGLPGVGPVLAERILAWREQHGRFTRVEDLKSISGLGGKKFDSLAPLVRV